MRSPKSLPFASLLTLVAIVFATACTTNPTAQEVVDQSAPAICDKAKECAAAAFTAAYPGGVDECVTKTKNEAAKKYGSDLSKSSVCTDDEVTKCLNDLKAAACPAGGALPTIPCQC